MLFKTLGLDFGAKNQNQKEDRKYKLRESIALWYRAIYVEGRLVVRSGDAFGGLLLLLLLFSGMFIGERHRVNKTSTK